MRELSFSHCGRTATAIEHVVVAYPMKIRFYWQCAVCGKLVFASNSFEYLYNLAASDAITDKDREFLKDMHISEKGGKNDDTPS
ncbi:MAG: hypothetical protein KGJ90_04925 [Patescibacteria group bacterium]|nr:hypothetical protein [Patescibacteria group bacterium]